MDNTDNAPVTEIKSGGFKVENIILLESSFIREVDTALQDIKVDNMVAIDSEAHASSPENKFGVTLTLHYSGMQKDIKVCSAKIKMLGIFERYGEPPMPEDSFKKINAPAIIYPFIREHLHNICLRSGIANVFLPTVNFKP